MTKIKEDMKDIGKVELHPKFDGKQMIMVIQPLQALILVVNFQHSLYNLAQLCQNLKLKAQQKKDLKYQLGVK